MGNKAALLLGTWKKRVAPQEGDDVLSPGVSSEGNEVSETNMKKRRRASKLARGKASNPAVGETEVDSSSAGSASADEPDKDGQKASFYATTNRFAAFSEQEDPQKAADFGLKRASPHDADEAEGEANRQLKRAKKSDSDKKAVGKARKKYPAFKFLQGAKVHHMIRLSDLRDLVLYMKADEKAPKWIAVENKGKIIKVVVLMVPGLEEAMFDADVDWATFKKNATSPVEGNNSRKRDPDMDGTTVKTPKSSREDNYPRKLDPDLLPTALQPMGDIFPLVWPIQCHGDDRALKVHFPAGAFLTAKASKKYKAYHRQAGGATGSSLPISASVKELLMTKEQLRDNHSSMQQPLHPVFMTEDELKQGAGKDVAWTDVDVATLSVPDGQIKVVGIDCEMVETVDGQDALARISLVDWDRGTLLDTLVKPPLPIKDYRTQWSGITEEKLRDVTTTVEDVQKQLLKIVTPTTVLVGHSLEGDMKAAKFAHPFLVDTSLQYLSGNRRQKLSYLTLTHLGRVIQTGIQKDGSVGHDSLEDAKAALDLVRLKCVRGKDYGNLSGENLFHKLARGSNPERPAGDVGANASSAAVEWGDPATANYVNQATHKLGCKNDGEVTEAVIRAVKGDEDGKEIPGGGVDFVWARMRELDVLRDWWRRDKQTKDMVDSMYDDDNDDDPALAGDSPIERCVSRLSGRIAKIYDNLPPCTAFIVFTGSGDPSALHNWQLKKQVFVATNAERQGTDSDALAKWPDYENFEMKRAYERARKGIAFITVK